MRLERASNSRRLHVDDTDKLGAGGEGAVYQVGDDLVAKIYHQPTAEQRAKIEAMLANPPADHATRGHRSIAWPIDLLVEAGRPSTFRGYLMPRIDTGTSLHQVADFNQRLTQRPYYTAHELHVIALNIASAFQALHHKGYVVGDVNDSNVMIDERGLATLIDTDSFQVPKDGGGWFRCRVGVAEFTPPELQQARLSQIDRREEHDLFGLGVLLFKLLMQGHHPFNGRESQGWTLAKRIESGNFPFGQRQAPIARPPMAPALAVLAPELRDLFLACFESGARSPDKRPSAGVWRQALNRARSDLKKCRAQASHRYSSQLRECPWCEIRKRITFANGDGLDFFPPSQGQMPLKPPGGSNQKRKKRRLSSTPSPSTKPGGSSAGSSAKLPPSLAALLMSQPSTLPSQASTSPTTSASASSAAASSNAAANTAASNSAPSSFGELVGKAVVRGLGAWLSNAVAGRPAGAAQPGGGYQAGPEIGPGSWQFQLATPAISLGMGTALLGCQVTFFANGGFQGSGMLYTVGRQMPCQLSGQWQYDGYSKVLHLQTMINGTPPQADQLRIVGGGRGLYQLISGVGLQYQLRRL